MTNLKNTWSQLVTVGHYQLIGAVKPKTHASILAVVNLMESDMKRMSEVFELPVSDVELEIYGCFYREGVQMADGEKAAAHAINHVDALADALEDLMRWHVENVNVIHHPAYDYAHSALKAYRGEA